MVHRITGSLLYDLVECPHRVHMDLFVDASLRDPISRFVQLLWERGIDFEAQVIRSLTIPCIDLSQLPPNERERRTELAMIRGDTLIYGGRIRMGDLLGDPDLLRKQGIGYVAGDIKSGAAEEVGSDLEERKPKKHYAVQLALYTDILEQKKVSSGRYPFIWDIHGQEIVYDLDAPQGFRTPESLWDLYQETLNEARRIVSKLGPTRPALSSVCKLCHWRTSCINELEQLDDLSLVPELGRARRDAMLKYVPTLSHLAEMDIHSLIFGSKTVIPRVGPDTLARFQERARLQKAIQGEPYLHYALDLPHSETELFFDIEADPMRDICYLHGFLERHGQDGGTEKYVPFLAEAPTPTEEEKAFAGALEYIGTKAPCVIYYYSKYEQTWWQKLQGRYPSVASEEEIESLFHETTAVDLFNDVVRSNSVWPTRDHSIKTLASYLGFKWQDTSPSGAESIEWYHRWVESGDMSLRRRILDYNEDDCRATRVLLDGLRQFPVVPRE